MSSAENTCVAPKVDEDKPAHGSAQIMQVNTFKQDPGFPINGEKKKIHENQSKPSVQTDNNKIV